jgi:hypothetical protein
MDIKSVLIAVASSSLIAAPQAARDAELAQLISNDTTRQNGVDRIVVGGGREIPLLLSWTLNPPDHVDMHGLNVGLADVFGRLRTVEAIPFLIKNIRLQRWVWDFQSWSRAPQPIEGAFPAVAALIQIGPEASKALMRFASEAIPNDDRLPVIFVISQIALANANAQAERAFLSSALGEANLERFWAEEGLKVADEQH